MKDKDKTKEQLANELEEMRQRVTQFEALEAGRKRAEEALRQSEEKLRLMFESATDGIVVTDRNGNIMEVNEAAVRLYGSNSKEKLIGRSAFEFIAEKDRVQVMEVLKSALEDGQIRRNVEIIFLTEDGREYFAEVSSALLKDASGNPVGFIAITRDITERKQVEEALRQSEEKYRLLVDGASNPITVYDSSGVLLLMNASAAEALDGLPGDFVGKSIYEVHPSVADLSLKRISQVVESGERGEFESMVELPSGRKWFWSIFLPIRDIGGSIWAVQIISYDNTERKQMEEELEKYRKHLEELVEERTSDLKARTTELERANIRLQEADRLKFVFLASMSHELRTPLNSIIGFTGIILQGMSGEVSEEQRKQLTMMKNSASHLLILINNVLDISKIESGRVELTFEEFSLDDVVSEVVETLSSTASEKGLELMTEVPEGIALFSDRRRIKQVLINLVSNAVKFTDQGSVQIAARVPGDDNLEIRVIDTGIGIKEEDMDKLFQPFQQIGVSLTKKHEGTGLGLYLAEKLVTLLGGDISAKSQYGRGSEFTFTMPLRYEEDQESEENTGS